MAPDGLIRLRLFACEELESQITDQRSFVTQRLPLKFQTIEAESDSRLVAPFYLFPAISGNAN